MNTLIAYATYSSGTETVSELLEAIFKAKGWQVTRENIRNTSPSTFSQYDLILLGSPSWLNNKKDGQPHQFFLEFIQTCEGTTFPEKKFAIFGLGDTAYPNFCGAVSELEAFVQKMQGKLVTSSLRIDGYYFNEEENNTKVRTWTDQLFASTQE